MHLLAALLVLLAAVGPAFGQAPPGMLREAPTPPSPGALYLREKPGNALFATDYLGRAVHGPAKQKVGTISNLLVDTTGRVTGVVIDVGGFLGIGGKEIAIAFEASFRSSRTGGRRSSSR